MRLTTAQIAQIDETLVLNQVVYDDIKLELTDHIASDIEGIMGNGVAYEIAFKEAFEKWRLQLKPSKNSWWLGDKISIPRIILEEHVKQTKKELVYSLLGSVIITLFVDQLAISYGLDFLWIMKYSYLGIAFSIVAVLVLGRISILKNKRITTFTHLFEKRYTHRILMMIMFSYISYYSDFFDFVTRKFSVLQFSFIHFLIVFGFIQSYFTCRLLFKHFQFEKKLSKV